MSNTTSQPTGVTAVNELLTESERYDVLQSSRRRIALSVLEHESAPIHIDRLASTIAAQETASSDDEADPKRIAISLHHNHLPKLDDHGIVEYDTDSKEVAFTPSRRDLAR
ncbi:hypothetical protein VB773_22380 [Haloarculaceae archaeon H-GB2-1]|nr:hypothetical protein [Haloarculaceae archaeon H-GB1-1]MEA5410047.1 hypothetical protein [Haloarculaceae archaeon H-GB2-1]